MNAATSITSGNWTGHLGMGLALRELQCVLGIAMGQTSKELGKQVRLNILGGTIEMDRGMLDRMMPAFEHLLRNCVAHGIESPANTTEAPSNSIRKPIVGSTGR